MAINLKRSFRPAVATFAAAGSLGLLHCDRPREETAVERPIETPTMNEPARTPPAEPTAVGGGPTAAPGEPTAGGGDPSAVGGGPTATPEPSKAESRPARGVSAVEQYLDGKQTEVNRFALEGLTYEHACPYLTQEGVDSVDALADLLKRHPQARVSIESYTDNTGSDEANMWMSQRRAEVIKKQLVQCGVGADRIEAIGRGAENPIASNESDDGKAQNRRTEVILHTGK